MEKERSPLTCDEFGTGDEGETCSNESSPVGQKSSCGARDQILVESTRVLPVPESYHTGLVWTTSEE